MTLLRSRSPASADAIRLLSAVGDALTGRRPGFALRVAATAARFAAHRGCGAEEVAAVYFAAALHAIGAVRVVVPAGANERDAAIAAWDAPAAGAAIVAGLPGLPAAAADLIRWHREAFDGTGFPDRLRWNGIPTEAMAISIVRAFVERVDELGSDAPPAEALFALMNESGRRFSVTTAREFRAFFAAHPEGFDAPFAVEWDLEAFDSDAVIIAMCREIDARNERTLGRGDRLAVAVAAIAGKLAHLPIDPEKAALAARLTSLGKLHGEMRGDDYDPLSRLGREARAADAITAAQIVASAPSYAAFAEILAAVAEWHDGSGLPEHRKGARIDPLARILAVAMAAESLADSQYAQPEKGYPAPPVRIAAAAGTQFDPVVVEAYLATVGERR